MAGKEAGHSESGFRQVSVPVWVMTRAVELCRHEADRTRVSNRHQGRCRLHRRSSRTSFFLELTDRHLPKTLTSNPNTCLSLPIAQEAPKCATVGAKHVSPLQVDYEHLGLSSCHSYRTPLTPPDTARIARYRADLWRRIPLCGSRGDFLKGGAVMADKPSWSESFLTERAFGIG